MKKLNGTIIKDVDFKEVYKDNRTASISEGTKTLNTALKMTRWLITAFTVLTILFVGSAMIAGIIQGIWGM